MVNKNKLKIFKKTLINMKIYNTSLFLLIKEWVNTNPAENFTKEKQKNVFFSSLKIFISSSVVQQIICADDGGC